ncbi:MAG TPA: homoserine kinase [Actinomycetota bacterium]|nr:homoserine kinase [Actinomycetota bacterium]
MKLSVRVPATSANLGPGFDALALALALHNEVTVDTDAGPAVTVTGEGAGELPEDATNLVFRSMSYLAREAGGSLPSFHLDGANKIPLERGLGSSAAAVVAGLLLADRLLGTHLGPDRLLEVAIDIEGHPDNVAGCLRGGLVLAHLSSNGWRAERLEPHPDLRPIVLLPHHERLPTVDARRALPRQVPLEDAAFNVGRTALAVIALTQRPGLLEEALEDRLHQPHRLPLVPAARALYQDLRDRNIPVCVSGAGPSLLAFDRGDASFPDLGPGWRILRPEIDLSGATIS